MLGLVLASVALLGATAVAAVLAGRSDRTALRLATAGSVIACSAGAIAATAALLRGDRGSMTAAWALPVGQLHVGLDPLSSFFLVCVFVVSGLAAVYGGGYLAADIGKRRLAPVLFFFNLLVASMAALVIARDGILFLIAWEVMSLASYLPRHLRERARGGPPGRDDLPRRLAARRRLPLRALCDPRPRRLPTTSTLFAGAAAPAAGLATACFWLALVGFGTKAGFWPVHIWLPDAHPAAPSHVSALMSGVMIKMGIYGLLRTLDVSRAAAGVVGRRPHRDRRRVRSGRRPPRARAARPEAPSRVSQRREHRHHRPRHRRGAPRAESRQPFDRRFWATRAPCCTSLNHGLFKGLLFQARRQRAARDGHAGHRFPGRSLPPHAGDRRGLSARRRSRSAVCRP